MHADDSSAALGAGGIELTKSADIGMASEDLRISPDTVSIRYKFVNDGKSDLDTLVAFPLPDIDAYEYWGTPVGRMTDDPLNFVGFRVMADGKPVAAKVEQKAMHEGRDVTSLVKSVGLPVNVISDHNYERFKNLTSAQRKTLKDAGIAEFEIASAAHIRVADASAYYGLPEGQRGIFVGGGGSARVPRLAGVACMTDMMLTGRVLDAQEGQLRGISHYVVAKGEALAKGFELARQIATNAPLSNFAVMQALPRIADLSQSDGLFVEALMAAIAQGDAAAKQRVRAFLEKRAPKVERK